MLHIATVPNHTQIWASRLSALEVSHNSCNMGNREFAWNAFLQSEDCTLGFLEHNSGKLLVRMLQL